MSCCAVLCCGLCFDCLLACLGRVVLWFVFKYLMFSFVSLCPVVCALFACLFVCLFV